MRKVSSRLLPLPAETELPDETITSNEKKEVDAESLIVREAVAILRHNWKMLALCAFIGAAFAVFIAKAWMTPWYRATAIIRPMTQAGMRGQLANLASAGGAVSFGSGLVDFGGFASMGDAEQYIATMKSFAFDMSMVQRHDLVKELLPEEEKSKASEFAKSRLLQWKIYLTLKGRFDAKYSPATFQVGLSYVATSPEEAEQILGFYIDDLKAKLRNEQQRDARAAAVSLTDQAKVTSDALLKQQLYDLIAMEVRQDRLAQVDADFAFVVLEPPTSPPKPYRPILILMAVLGAALALCLLSGLLLFVGLRARIRHTMVPGRERDDQSAQF